MILGIVSDTHGHLEYTQAAIYILESFKVDQVLHCGDIGGPEVMQLFRQWKTHYVFGNVDDQLDVLRTTAKELGHIFQDAYGEIDFQEVRIAMLHGDDTQKLQQTISSQEFDLVCHGHTHQSKIEQQGSTMVLNPGALYRARPHSIAIVELPSLSAQIIPVC